MKNIPIPEQNAMDNWKTIELSENGEKLVSLKSLGHKYSIKCEPKYFEFGISGSINDCLVRKSVAKMLIDASKKLPKGHSLLIWDTWRPVEVQQALFNQFKEQFRTEKPNLTEEELITYTQKYVSLPSIEFSKPSPHITGGAVDLTICDTNGIPLNMGTEFDEMTSVALTRYFETKSELTTYEQEALENRRLLYHILTEVGFSNYPEEWWHFDFGNQFWSKQTEKKPFYSVVFPEN